MLRRLIALTVLLALASGPVLRMAVVGDYLVRFETYAAACENLARPEMQCNGSCQLSKQLKAIEDQGAPDPLSAEWLKLKIGEFGGRPIAHNGTFPQHSARPLLRLERWFRHPK